MAPKQKILFVITQGKWGGAQKYVHDLAKKLTNDFVVELAIGEPKGEKDLLDKLENKIKIYQLARLKRAISPRQDILAIFELARLYKNTKPDIVHLNSSKASIIGSLAGRLAGRHRPKIIYTAHGWVFNEPLNSLKKFTYLWLEKYTARFKDKIIALSESDRQDGLEKLKIKKEKILIIPLGLEKPTNVLNQTQARAELAKYDVRVLNKKLIGTVANFYATKGHDILLSAINQIKTKLPDDCLFVLIGSGPKQIEITKYIKDNNLNDLIVIIDEIKNDAVRYLPAFDLLVLPSKKEGLPYTILEARQQNIPIIATNVGGVGSLIQDQQNGRLVPASDPHKLAQAIIACLQNPQQTKKYANAAPASVKNFDLDEMARQTSNLYHTLF